MSKWEMIADIAFDLLILGTVIAVSVLMLSPYFGGAR